MARRDRPDHYSRRAKKEGYQARSVYKLSEIDEKAGILSRGARVLDVGAAPGSWSRYALDRVGENGFVCSVDLKPIDLPSAANLRTIEGDVLDPAVRATLREAGPFDAVISDAAPSTTGNRTVDSARSAELVETVIGLADEVLAPGGHLVAKLFQGGDEQTLLRSLQERFARARIQRPRASRSDSFEVFLVGTDFRPPGTAERAE